MPDTNVLYSYELRDLFVWLKLLAAVQVAIAKEGFEELYRVLARERGQNTVRLRERLERALSDSIVSGHERLVLELSLPDPGDRHVVAVAIYHEAEFIVTFNLKDFPVDALARHGVQPVHPDHFLCMLLEVQPNLVLEAIDSMGYRRERPPRTRLEIADALARAQVPLFSARLKELIGRV